MSGDAQLGSIDREEAGLELLSFSAEDAWWLGEQLRRMAVERGAKVAIEVRKGSIAFFRTVLPGATPDNVAWAQRKLETTMHFERSSYAMYLMLKAKGVTVSHFGLDPARFVAGGGAVPIRVRAVGVVGAVAVSGLPHEEDHQLVVDALTMLRDRPDRSVVA